MRDQVPPQQPLRFRGDGRERFLEMYDPPNLQLLQEELKGIEKAELQAKQQELAAEKRPGGKG